MPSTKKHQPHIMESQCKYQVFQNNRHNFKASDFKLGPSFWNTLYFEKKRIAHYFWVWHDFKRKQVLQEMLTPFVLGDLPFPKLFLTTWEFYRTGKMKAITTIAKHQIVFTSSKHLYIHYYCFISAYFSKTDSEANSGLQSVDLWEIYAFCCLFGDTIYFIKSKVSMRKFLLWEILNFQVEIFTLQWCRFYFLEGYYNFPWIYLYEQG